MKIPDMVTQALDRVARKFEDADYNPTPLIDLGAIVANADGKVDDGEKAALAQLLEPLLHAHLVTELVGFPVDASLKVLTRAGTARRLDVLAAILHDCDAVDEAVIVALAIGLSAGKLGDPEKKVIGELGAACELEPERLAELTRQVTAAYQE